jgi:hypothetical protein
MKATGQKLKKLKTRQIYGFKKEQFSGGSGDPTILTTLTGLNNVLNEAI